MVLLLGAGTAWAQSDYSAIYTNNITLSKEGGSNVSECIVKIGDQESKGLKAGTSSKTGAVKITVPKGAKYLHLHIAAWNNETVVLSVVPENISEDIALTANSGISSNSPFTFEGDASTSDYYKVITFANALAEETALTFTATSGKRFVVFGVNSEEEGGTQPVVTYSVTYDCNGGTDGCPEDLSGIEAGTSITIADAPTKTDYSFDGWSDGTELFEAGASYIVNKNVTFKAQWTKNGGGEPVGNEEWVATSLENLVAGDIIVIVGNNGETFAMSNDKGTGAAPSVVAVTVDGEKLTGTIDANIQWTFSGNATDGYTFYASDDTWLYCTNSNNGVRVGTNDNKTFKVEEGYLFHNGTSRYVGIYSSQDWRCYTSINSNIENQTFTYFKKVEASDPTKSDPKFSFGENTEFTVLPNAEFTAPTLTFADSFDGTVKYSSSNEEVALVDESTGDVVIGEKEGQAIITAKSEATENFKAGSASYKINVKDNRQELTMSWSESEVNIALGATEADYTLPTLNPADIKVSLESDNEDVAVIVDGKVVVGTDAIGKARITAKFAGNDTYKPTTASYTISVYDPNKKGTINNPYTVAEALENTPAEGTSEEVYVKGIVSGFYGENTSITGDRSHRYYISDDGTTDVQLLVYNGKGKDNVAFSNDDDLLIGDEVVIVGKLTTYQETKEFAKDNYIVSLIRIEKIDPALSFGETTEFSVSLGETFTAPSLTFVEGFTGTVTYSSDKKEVAMVDEATGEVVLMGIAGTAKITASFAGSIEYKASSASYTIKVIDPNANDGSLEKPFTVAEVINGTASGSDIYVKGFIVGGYAKAAPIVDLSKLEASNIALADKADEVDGSKTIPVQLLKDTEPRTNFNLVDHAYNIAVAQVLVKANVDTYFSVNGLKGTSEIAKIAEQLTISDAGLATYYTDCALDFTGFDDMYAYTASFKNNGLELTRIKGVVPAETGVLLRNPKGGAVSNLVPVAEDAEAIANNAFIGTLEDITIKKNDDEGNTYYILGKNKDGNIGFYWASEDGTLVASHKAYVKVAGSAGDATRFDLNFNDLVTGIKGVGASESKGTVYDLQGRQVAQPTKGLYIVDGKKVVIK